MDRSQHLIIFFLAKLSVEAEKLPIMLDRNEVERAAWVPMPQIMDILNSKDGRLPRFKR